MKKVINSLLGLFTFAILFFGFSYAKECITLGHNDVCIDLQKRGDDYTMTRSVTCRDGSCSLRCDVVLPHTIENVGSCNGSFEYDSNSTETIKVNININGVPGQITGKYNFRSGKWTSSSSHSYYDDDDDDYYYDDDDDYYYDDDDDDYYYNDDLDISANSSSLSTSQYLRLTINTDDDYVGKVKFSLKYRALGSSSRSSISRTSSTYVSNYSSVWSNGYYKMTYSDDGEKTLNSLVKFKKAGYYRIIAEDEDGNEDYVDVRVSSSSSYDNDYLDISANSSNLSSSQYLKLTINTDDDYVGKVNFSLKYRSSSSSSRSSITRTSSTYVSNYSSVWSNGYYKMTSSDDGEKVLSNLVKFKKTGYYRITAEDEDGNEDYVDIRVTSSSSYDDDDEYIDGYTSEEFAMVKRIYNVWPTLISKLKSENPSLRNNTSWINLSNNLYTNMADVINDVYDREYTTYNKFFSAFNIRYNRTINLIN